jgi:hypothetical protein
MFPQNPVDDEPEVFEQGMFFAMVPDVTGLPEANGNTMWPSTV